MLGNGNGVLPGDFGTLNSRYVNPSALTLNAAFGISKDNWNVELFVDNLNNEEATLVQIAGYYTPQVVNQRPLTFGLRIGYQY